MEAIMEVLGRILVESWLVLEESSLFLILGFLVAAAAKALLPDRLVAAHLGGLGLGSVLKASAMGVPLPLCSCGVLPAAAGLRRQGAGPGATAAFLVSTPETGADSIAVTYALLDPVMAVIRPLAAFVTATLAGILVNLGYRHQEEEAPAAPEAECACGCSRSAVTPAASLGGRFVMGLRYAFGELLGDIGKWLLLGVLLAGTISALAPESFIRANLSHGIWPMLVMLAVSAPLYVCATSSTPIAAALVLKGLSPGAALVFLLAGPATNAATLVVSMKVLGRRGALLALAAIIGVALAAGLLTDQLYIGLGLSTAHWAAREGNGLHGAVALTATVTLLALLAWNMLRELWRRRALRRADARGSEGGACRAVSRSCSDQH